MTEMPRNVLESSIAAAIKTCSIATAIAKKKYVGLLGFLDNVDEPMSCMDEILWFESLDKMWWSSEVSLEELSMHRSLPAKSRWRTVGKVRREDMRFPPRCPIAIVTDQIKTTISQEEKDEEEHRSLQ